MNSPCPMTMCVFFFNRLFVGAPRANYTKPTRNQLQYMTEPGVVYRCALPGPCVEIEPAVIEDEYTPVYVLQGRIMKEHSWFGGAMSIERSSGFLTVCARSGRSFANLTISYQAALDRSFILLQICAPRTIMSIIKYNGDEAHTMHGMCYNSQAFWNTTVDTDKSYIKHYGTHNPEK